MKNKVLATIVLATLATVWLVWSTSANFLSFSQENRTEIRELMEKVRSWETLTTEEQAKLDELKYQLHPKGFTKGKDWVMKWLTQEEKTSLESMTTEERQAFFEQKKAEIQAQMEVKKAERDAHESVIDKLINGDSLSAEEQVILEEIKQKRAERQELRALMDKLRVWDELTVEEQAKHDELKSSFTWKVVQGRWFTRWGFGMHR